MVWCKAYFDILNPLLRRDFLTSVTDGQTERDGRIFLGRCVAGAAGVPVCGLYGPRRTDRHSHSKCRASLLRCTANKMNFWNHVLHIHVRANDCSAEHNTLSMSDSGWTTIEVKSMARWDGVSSTLPFSLYRRLNDLTISSVRHNA